MRTFEIIEWVTLANGDTVRRVKETKEFPSLERAMIELRMTCNHPFDIDYRIKDNELIAFNKDADDVELYIIKEA